MCICFMWLWFCKAQNKKTLDYCMNYYLKIMQNSWVSVFFLDLCGWNINIRRVIRELEKRKKTIIK